MGDKLFKQEYPATDTEAFLSTGNPFFDREALLFLPEKCSKLYSVERIFVLVPDQQLILFFYLYLRN